LRALHLSDNQLQALPADFAKLSQLQWLDLSNNQFQALPADFAKLSHVRTLDLRNNRLQALPQDFAKLSRLQWLYLSNNRLQALPQDFAKLTQLQLVDLLSGNPELKDPPPYITKLGTAAIIAYLGEKAARSRMLWECKTLIVGEGNIGKTWLYEALHGRLAGGSRKDSGATVGIEIGLLPLPHPQEAGVAMQLHCWDFAGQEQNYATHQFFFSEQSLILLVWDMRGNYDDGQMRKWLTNLRDRAPQAKVILVGTQCDEPHGSYPKTELQKEFPQIVHACEVSSKTGEGIQGLKAEMQRHAAALGTMGQEWPESWWQGMEALAELGKTRPHVSLKEAEAAVMACGVSKEPYSYESLDLRVHLPSAAAFLMRSLNMLGRIIHYADSEELAGVVVLDPQWLTNCIGRVLACNKDGIKQGFLPRPLMAELWGDLALETRQHLLGIMDKFDLAYEIPDDIDKRWLVVEKLPQDPPVYQDKWDTFASRSDLRLRYKLKDLHPGIPSWFIARCHRFTQDQQWLRGVLLGEPRVQPTSLALVRAQEASRTVDFTVRGLLPPRFMGILTDSFEDTVTKLYPGLVLERWVPCPTMIAADSPCPGQVKLENLERLLEKHLVGERKSSDWECPDCGVEHSLEGLLVGLSRAPGQDALNTRAVLEAIETARADVCNHMDRRLLETRLYLQDLFISEWNAAQEAVDLSCPSVFAFYQKDGKTLRYEEEYVLQLCCMNPDGWHGLGDAGLVTFRPAREWWAKTVPYLQSIAKWLKPITLIGAVAAGPVTGIAGAVAGAGFHVTAEQLESTKKDLDRTSKLCESLEKMEVPKAWKLAGADDHFGRPHDWSHETTLRELKEALSMLDYPVKPYGGLVRYRTRAGKTIWLCGDCHRKAVW
jgi:GTPase SAR1 family protein